MLYAAAFENNERISATPKARALCPSCGDTVIAKCGFKKIWHWAHKVTDCDAWAEGETDWAEMVERSDRLIPLVICWEQDARDGRIEIPGRRAFDAVLLPSGKIARLGPI